MTTIGLIGSGNIGSTVVTASGSPAYPIPTMPITSRCTAELLVLVKNDCEVKVEKENSAAWSRYDGIALLR